MVTMQAAMGIGIDNFKKFYQSKDFYRHFGPGLEEIIQKILQSNDK